MFWKKPNWSKIPGCFERHLQRRVDNVLFSLERRSVSREDVEQAQQRDNIEQDRFNKKVVNFGKELENLENIKPQSTVQDTSFLEKIHDLLIEAASIGGNIQNAIKYLEDINETMIKSLNASMPEGKHLLEKADAFLAMQRTPYMAQLQKKNTPILENEQVSTLLCEDLPTIAVVGLASRTFPNFKPTSADIIKYLDEAVRQGFNKEYAKKIIDAWNDIPRAQINNV